MLIKMLTPLSLSPGEQIEHLRKQGFPDCIDDLAEDFDSIALAAPGMLRSGELTLAQYECVKQLDSFLESFSGHENTSLWTAEALHSAPQWQKVRAMASECLAQLKQSVD